MANLEQLFNVHVIRHGKIAVQEAIEFGIVSDDFKTAEGKATWHQIINFFNSKESQGAVLTPELILHQFPTLELPDLKAADDMTTKAFCHLLRLERVKKEGAELSMAFAKLVQIDPVSALADFQTKVGYMLSIATSRNTDVTLAAALDGIIQEIEDIENGVIRSKAMWPWFPLQDATLGVQDDDYIVIYGRPKSKKSFVLSFLVAFWFMSGKRVVVYTKEMTPHNMYRRIAAFICRIRYSEMRGGKMQVTDKQELYDLRAAVRELQQSENIICLSGQDVSDGADTVAWVQSKIELYKPDVCAIDGLYLLSTMTKHKSDHERVREISRSTRNMILRTKVPVACTLQANRQAAKHSNAELDEIAFSDAIGQDATIAMRCIASKTEQKISLVMAGSREFELEGFSIKADLCRDMSFLELLHTKQILDAKEADSADDEETRQEKLSSRARPRKRSAQVPATNDGLDLEQSIREAMR